MLAPADVSFPGVPATPGRGLASCPCPGWPFLVELDAGWPGCWGGGGSPRQRGQSWSCPLALPSSSLVMVGGVHPLPLPPHPTPKPIHTALEVWH